MKEKKVILGGTFDLLHAGHKALLKKAFSLGQVNIGLVSDEMAAQSKIRKIAPFFVRKSELESFIAKERQTAVIFEISDKFGPAIKEDFDFIVVSPETHKTALEINETRKNLGKRPMEIIKIDYIFAEDLLPISSTRIAAGKIDKEGNVLK